MSKKIFSYEIMLSSGKGTGQYIHAENIKVARKELNEMVRSGEHPELGGWPFLARSYSGGVRATHTTIG